MKKIVYFLLLSLAISGCNTSTESTDKAVQNVPAEKVLYTIESKHNFSDNSAEDLFKLTVEGTDMLHARVKFQIISPKNQIIYVDNFETTDLIGYAFSDEDTAKVTDKMREEYIVKRLKTFFDKANFRSPAISPEGKFDNNYSDEESWNDIKSDNSAVGFHYLTGKSDVKYIAYSKLQGKVVVYLNCC